MEKKAAKSKVDELVVKVSKIFHKSRRIYGVRRIKAALALGGIQSSLQTICKKFHKYGIVARTMKKYKAEKPSIANSCTAINILNQKFYIDKPNHSRVNDFTYIKTSEGWSYLAVIIDLFSRKTVGWELSRDMNNKMVLNAMYKAISDLKSEPNIIVYSDRGIQ